MRRFPAWSVVVVAVVSLAAGIVVGRLPWREWIPRPRGVFAGSTAEARVSAVSGPHFIPPDYTNLAGEARYIAELEWWHERMGVSRDTIRDLRLVRSETLKHTLVPDSDAHLIMVHVTSSRWQFDGDVLMVFDQDDTPLLAAIGTALTYRIVDLGARARTYALIVRNNWSVSTGPIVTVTAIYVYRPCELGEVFHQDTSYDGRWTSYPDWAETSMRFQDSGRYLKDILITAHVYRRRGLPEPSSITSVGTQRYQCYKRDADGNRISVFRWNGDHYDGTMNVRE